jgi:hypothetical protein
MDIIPYDPSININITNFNIFNQSITLCWLQTIIISLFFSDGFREYIFHKLFNLITTKEENIKFPYSSKFPLILPSHSSYHIDDYKIIRNYLYLVIEIIRKTIVYSNEEITDICDYALQKLICESDDIIKYLFGCANICSGGYNNNFINLLNEYYNTSITSREFNLSNNLNILNEININTFKPFSLIIYLNKSINQIGHVISIIKINNQLFLYDNETKNFIDSIDNISLCSKPLLEIMSLNQIITNCTNTHITKYINDGYLISAVNLLELNIDYKTELNLNTSLQSKTNLFENIFQTKNNEIKNTNINLINNIPIDHRNIFFELIDELTRNKLYKLLFPNIKETILSLKGGNKLINKNKTKNKTKTKSHNKYKKNKTIKLRK